MDKNTELLIKLVTVDEIWGRLALGWLDVWYVESHCVDLFLAHGQIVDAVKSVAMVDKARRNLGALYAMRCN